MVLKPLLIAIMNERDDEILNKVKAATAQYDTPAAASPVAAGTDGGAPAAVMPLKVTLASMTDTSGSLDLNDQITKEELDPLRLDLGDFLKGLFRAPPCAEAAANAASLFFRSGPDPDYITTDGLWKAWPANAKEKGVRAFLGGMTIALQQFVTQHKADYPGLSLHSGISKNLSSNVYLVEEEGNQEGWSNRKLGTAFVPLSQDISTSRWAEIMVPIEITRDPTFDGHPSLYELSKFALKALNNQPTRHFMLGLTLCGPFLRVWHIDRSGALGSQRMDVNAQPEVFLQVMLSLHCMSLEDLGFDPSILQDKEGCLYTEVPDKVDGIKRFFLDGPCFRYPKGIVSRATTIWKGHFEGEPASSRILKSTFQPEDCPEGSLNDIATRANVQNFARCSHFWTVEVGGAPLDTQRAIRKDIDISKGRQYVLPAAPRIIIPKKFGHYSDISSAGLKRSYSQAFAGETPRNLVLRRMIMAPVGRPIFQANSPATLLRCMIQCIQGHKQLFNAGILHRDISINNLMINEDQSDPNLSAFLIDLDHATLVDDPSDGDCRTGTRVFMSCAVLEGKPVHYLEDDLESFFWVLFWICTHYSGPGPDDLVIVLEHEKWYTEPITQVVGIKRYILERALYTQKEYWTDFYQPLYPCALEFAGVMASSLDKGCNDIRVYDKVLQVLSKHLEILLGYA